MAINDHVYGIPDGPDLNTYEPNYEILLASLAKNPVFKTTDKHEARSPREKIIECVRDQTPCSMEKRKAISKNMRSARLSVTGSPSNKMLTTDQNENTE